MGFADKLPCPQNCIHTDQVEPRLSAVVETNGLRFDKSRSLTSSQMLSVASGAEASASISTRLRPFSTDFPVEDGNPTRSFTFQATFCMSQVLEHLSAELLLRELLVRGIGQYEIDRSGCARHLRGRLDNSD